MDALTPLTYAILVALADAPKHGYGIIKEIEAREVGAGPSTGALYLALQRMEGQGLIAEAEVQPDDSTDQRRRYWALTSKGRDSAERESYRLATLVAAARDKKLLAGESA